MPYYFSVSAFAIRLSDFGIHFKNGKYYGEYSALRIKINYLRLNTPAS